MLDVYSLENPKFVLAASYQVRKPCNKAPEKHSNSIEDFLNDLVFLAGGYHMNRLITWNSFSSTPSGDSNT
jgi:hypothetical protein